MEFVIKRKVKKEVEESTIVQLRKYWVVRIISNQGCKSCIYEKEFDYVPTQQEIADILAPYINRKCFASVVGNYRFDELKENNDEKN